MIRVGSIVVRVDDLQRQTEFWEATLDYVRRESDSDDFVLLRPRDGWWTARHDARLAETPPPKAEAPRTGGSA